MIIHISGPICSGNYRPRKKKGINCIPVCHIPTKLKSPRMWKSIVTKQ